MQKRIKKWEELTFKDHFLFERVMQNAVLSRRFLANVHKRGIGELTLPPQSEAILDVHFDAKSIRLDVLAHEDNGAIHDIELQNSPLTAQDIAKRARYYRSTIDQDFLAKGKKYRDLPEVAVIFLCDFDPFGKGWYRYAGYTACCGEEGKLLVPDDAVVIFFNIHGPKGHESPDMRSLFAYMATGTIQGDFAAALDAEVQKIKSDEQQRSAYMSLSMLLDDTYTDGYADGKDVGFNQGKDVGFNQGKDVGFNQGKDVGFNQGKASERRDIAQRLLRRGVSLDIIAEDTGMSVVQLQKLQGQQA